MQPNNLDPAQTPTPNDGQPNISPPPQISSFGGRVLQPLSSEEDIKAEITTIAPVSVTEQAAPSEEASLNSYGVATEPIRRLPETPLAMSTQSYRAPQVSPEANITSEHKKSRRGLAIFISVLGIVIAGLVATYFVFAMQGKISAGDLIEAKTQMTSYLRPKQWQAIGDDAMGYRDGIDKYGKSTALVSITVSPAPIPGAMTATKDTYETYRTMALGGATAAPGQTSAGMCGSDAGLKKEADTSSTPTTEGLYRATTTCERDGKTYALYTRGVIGHDGYVRSILIMATQSSWDKNEDVFQKMLDSLQQIDS